MAARSVSICVYKVLNGNLKTSSWKLTTSSGIWVIEKRKRVVERNSLVVYGATWISGWAAIAACNYRDHVNPPPSSLPWAWWNATINMICIENCIARNYKLRRNAFTPLGLFIQRFNTQLLDLYMSFFGRLKYSRF